MRMTPVLISYTGALLKSQRFMWAGSMQGPRAWRAPNGERPPDKQEDATGLRVGFSGQPNLSAEAEYRTAKKEQDHEYPVQDARRAGNHSAE